MMQLRRGLLLLMAVVTVLSLWVAGNAQKRRPDVIYEPTPQDVVEQMLKMAGVNKDDIVYDLGCGDGRFVITAAKQFGARGVGVDIDPERIKEGNENALKAGVTDRVRFIEADLFQTDISKATVVTLYLLQRLNLDLRPKLLRELRPGTRIVSYSFDMEDWKPDKKGRARNSMFYYWLVPADVGGQWHWSLPSSQGEQPCTLRLDQTFQEISGKMNIQGRKVSIADAKLTGDQLSFTVRYKADGQGVMMRFRGRISRDTINGNVEVNGGPFAGNHTWIANHLQLQTPRAEQKGDLSPLVPYETPQAQPVVPP